MPVKVSYPGVYLEELTSSVHTITGVSTSVAAVIGNFGKGPINEPVQIFNMGDFERSFGGITKDSEGAWLIGLDTQFRRF